MSQKLNVTTGFFTLKNKPYDIIETAGAGGFNTVINWEAFSEVESQVEVYDNDNNLSINVMFMGFLGIIVAQGTDMYYFLSQGVEEGGLIVRANTWTKLDETSGTTIEAIPSSFEIEEDAIKDQDLFYEIVNTNAKSYTPVSLGSEINKPLNGKVYEITVDTTKMQFKTSINWSTFSGIDTGINIIYGDENNPPAIAVTNFANQYYQVSYIISENEAYSIQSIDSTGGQDDEFKKDTWYRVNVTTQEVVEEMPEPFVFDETLLIEGKEDYFNAICEYLEINKTLEDQFDDVETSFNGALSEESAIRFESINSLASHFHNTPIGGVAISGQGISELKNTIFKINSDNYYGLRNNKNYVVKPTISHDIMKIVEECTDIYLYGILQHKTGSTSSFHFSDKFITLQDGSDARCLVVYTDTIDESTSEKQVYYYNFETNHWYDYRTDEVVYYDDIKSHLTFKLDSSEFSYINYYALSQLVIPADDIAGEAFFINYDVTDDNNIIFYTLKPNIDIDAIMAKCKEKLEANTSDSRYYIYKNASYNPTVQIFTEYNSELKCYVVKVYPAEHSICHLLTDRERFDSIDSYDKQVRYYYFPKGIWCYYGSYTCSRISSFPIIPIIINRNPATGEYTVPNLDFELLNMFAEPYNKVEKTIEEQFAEINNTPLATKTFDLTKTVIKNDESYNLSANYPDSFFMKNSGYFANFSRSSFYIYNGDNNIPTHDYDAIIFAHIGSSSTDANVIIVDHYDLTLNTHTYSGFAQGATAWKEMTYADSTWSFVDPEVIVSTPILSHINVIGIIDENALKDVLDMPDTKTTLAEKFDSISQFPACPATTDGTYVLEATVADGEVTYTWVLKSV